MGAFDDIKVTWAGTRYTIPARKALGAVARIEEFITLRELITHIETRQFPLGRIAQAWGAVLRYAGADLADEDVYEQMFPDAQVQISALLAMQGLVEMMIPPSVRARMLDKAPAPVLATGEKDPALGNRPAAAKPLSKRSSGSRSVKTGARKSVSGTSRR